MTLLEVCDLSRCFGSKTAVKSASFSLKPGEIVGLLGSNGAGKSTTMRMIVGTIAPDSGTARIAGFDIRSERAQAQSNLGYLPEAANGFADLYVAEFLMTAAATRKISTADTRDAVQSALDLLDLRQVANIPLGTLSKGWRQRAWLAQALIHDPPVLVLDEPTDGLDPLQKTELRKLLKKISRDKAILMSTHILEEAEELCDRIVVMHDGRVVRDDKKQALSDSRGRLAPAILALTANQPEDAGPSP